MKKYFIGLLVLMLAVMLALIFGPSAWWNFLKYRFVEPKNYKQCVDAGGISVINRQPKLPVCVIDGKTFHSSLR